MQKRIKIALTASKPNVAMAANELRQMAAATPTPSMLNDAVKGGLIADIKSYRKHADKKVATLSAGIFDKFKGIMTQKYL